MTPTLHPSRATQLRLHVASLWMSMVVALFCALVPVGAPLTTPLGSAFNPSTTLVALNATTPKARAAASVRDDDPTRADLGIDLPDRLVVQTVAVPVSLDTGHADWPAPDPRLKGAVPDASAWPRAPPIA
ncbi:hypothetical protein TPR58_21230 [Sphingomonas sp. HF-S3]|uniref:Uncharacterized protein n=1 Tax=Sphingomonas rustica TaxID=3103142 RepID=A0ABV0BHZ8_9SPHN